MDRNFYPLKVSDVKRETKDAVSLTFDVPQDLSDTFQFIQGQYVTLKLKINGNEVRRAYSMSSSPLDKRTTVTIKQIPNGLVSTHVNTKTKVGDTIEVMPPQGRFYTKMNPENRKTYYLFGGGSGITPLMSILKTVVEEEPQSTVFLFYGNKDEESIIFKDELTALKKRYEGQLIVQHILSDPIKTKAGGLTSFFKKPTINWKGKIGVPDPKQTKLFLDEHPARNKNTEYFICGPGPMMDSVESVLNGLGIDKKTIHIERFSSAKLPHETDKEAVTATASEGSGAPKAIVHLDGKRLEIEMKEGEKVLDALLRHKVEPPYSCTSGACSTCMAKMIKGEAEMEVCYALDDDEVEEGYILTCQAVPKSGEIELTFEV